MKIRIIGIPHFEIEINREIITMLTGLSAQHYDGVCKDAGRVGGFIYGWKNQLDDLPVCTVMATRRQLDISLKICEVANLGVPGISRPLVFEWMRNVVLALLMASDQDWELYVPEYVSNK